MVMFNSFVSLPEVFLLLVLYGHIWSLLPLWILLPINKSLYQIKFCLQVIGLSFGRQVPVKAKARAAKRKAGASVGMVFFFVIFYGLMDI
jgi:hypothetical protein